MPQSGFGTYILFITLRCKAFLSEHIFKSTGLLIFFPNKDIHLDSW